MWDATGTEKSNQEDFTRFKKTIQEIVGMSKSKTSEKPTKIKKKKQEPMDRSENLMKQFLELKEFQKGLAAATLDGGGNKANSKKVSKSTDYTDSSSGASECAKGSMWSSSFNSTTANNKKKVKERAKREEYDTDELSDTSSSEDSDQIKGYATEGTVSDESNSEVTSSKYDYQPKRNSGLTLMSKTQNETSSPQPVKKKSALSPSELAIIKDLCRDLIKKEEKPIEDSEPKPGLSMKETKVEDCPQATDEEVCSEKEKDKSIKIEPEDVENQECKMQTKNKENHEYNVEPENIEKKYNTEAPVLVTEQNKISEIIKCDESSNEEVTNAVIVKGELTLISEHKEIVRKETVEEVDEWKQRIEEKVVIEKTIKVNLEEAEVTEKETKERKKETKEVALCNMSDDDLIRKTIREMDQIDQEFMVEKAPHDEESENYYYGEIGDGDNAEEKRSLQVRIDRLQEQIINLRGQLEEAKQQNEEEAKEIGYLSALLADRGSSLLRSGLEWDEWEVKEMVRERLQQRREAAAQDYQSRLRVIEALCSAEMGKLEEALQTLVPLNATVSAWNPPAQPPDVSSSSWQTQDYFFEVVTSMNLSSSDANGVSGTISTNGEQPSLTEWKAEGQ